MGVEAYKECRGLVESYVCNRGTTIQRAIKNINTRLKKAKLTDQDIEKILAEVNKNNVSDFENSTAFPNLFQERKQRFELIEKELQQLLNIHLA